MITRINHFTAKAGREDDLYTFLQSVIAIVERCKGCIGCRLLRSTEASEKMAIIEEWESIAVHQEAAKAIPPEMMQVAMGLFGAPPSGAYYKA